MSTTACRRDARDPGMQAFRLRSWNPGVPLVFILTIFVTKNLSCNS
ncbi:MAG: hypothetical protein LBP59_12915 [Planctomycetaceae bacterium]|nr:hypothetical protein [Planctomycetaceae bacterium]